jgi:hypothetical protein
LRTLAIGANGSSRTSAWTVARNRFGGRFFARLSGSWNS